MIIVKSAFLIILFFSVVTLKGQYALGDFDLEENTYAWYDQALGIENAGIVRGSNQKINRTQLSDPFFEGRGGNINTVKYRGMVFDMFVMYDIQNDYLLIRHPTEYKYLNSPIKLNQEQVDWFTIDDHTFRFYPESILSFKPGFYEELFIGENINFIIKHSKNLIINDQLDQVFNKEATYLIKYEEDYFELKGRRSFLKIFDYDKDLKKKLRNFIKSSGLKFREGYQSDIIALAEFMEDQLMK